MVLHVRALEPGLAIGAGLLAGGLLASGVLVATGRRPVSTCVRTSWPARIIAGALAAHLVLSLPHDPLSWLGHRIEDLAHTLRRPHA